MLAGLPGLVKGAFYGVIFAVIAIALFVVANFLYAEAVATCLDITCQRVMLTKQPTYWLVSIAVSCVVWVVFVFASLEFNWFDCWD